MTGLRFDQLSLRLRGRPVLSGVSGIVASGEVLAILGPNGAGKSSLLSCLAGLRRPDSGAVTLDGAPLAMIDRLTRARQIGLLPQRGELHWDMSVAALVALGRLPHRGRWGGLAPADHEAIAAAMASADVAHLADRNVRRLSGGEQARVLLARVLAGEPDWLLADEPLESLDPAHQLDTLARLRDCAARGAGVVVVLHDLGLAARFADRVLLMKDGAVLACGTADEVMTPALLGEAYGISVEIGRSASGQLQVVPIAKI